MTDVPVETEEQSTLEWIWGVLEGDFNENPTVGQIITNAAITAIPLVDQVADARDLVANLKALIWDKRYNEIAVWLGLFFTLIGLIPSLGSLLKGVLKLIYRGAKLDEVFKVFNALAKGNAWEWLQKLRAGELRKHADEATRMLKQVIDNIIDTLNEALSYVPRWSDDLYRKLSDLIAELRVIRGKIEDMFGQITKELEQKLDDLLAKQEKNQVEGGSRDTLLKKQEADAPPPSPPIRVEKPGNQAEKHKAFTTDEDVPSIYKSDPRFKDLASDPDHAGAIKPTTRAEAMAGLEAERQGHIKSPIERGPRGIEFYDGNGNAWDVKAPPSAKPGKRNFFNAEESGESIRAELRTKGSPPGTFQNAKTGEPTKRGVILDSTYMNEHDHQALWKWLNENLTKDELSRIVEVVTKL